MSWSVVHKTRTISPEETQALASRLLERLHVGDAVALTGELGAGKTTFVRGLIRAMGYEGRVRSPSYTLVQRYPTQPPVTHADLYRLLDKDELIALNLVGDRERGILVVEWADRLQDVWGIPDWRVEFSIPEQIGDNGNRDITILCAREERI
ncbi:MAG: tRNA (adenosine(37)-N6)-threonylcarbamoyltransferase complex ATPase subunit type 1 TsaE [bacterium]